MISATKEIDLDQLIFCLGRASWKSGFNTVLFQYILEDCYCEQKHYFFIQLKDINEQCKLMIGRFSTNLELCKIVWNIIIFK